MSRLLPLVLVALALCATACVYLPRTDDAVASFAKAPQDHSRIALAVENAGVDSPRALLIEDPGLALASRIQLIDTADISIDVQYFIWQNDQTGLLVVERLLAAADRGVRVRALFDDMQADGLVDRLSALNEHPNIEIRIFNPFSIRLRLPLGLIRLAEVAIDGNRLNHRMHNKLLVADNQLALLGGRNIGDDYFGQSAQRNFVDTDILLSGEIVPELSAGFDDYWNSRWASPVKALLNVSFVSTDLDDVREWLHERVEQSPELQRLASPAPFADTAARLAAGALLDWSAAVVDDPDVSWSTQPREIAARLTEIALTAQREVLIVSPYLIPTPNLLPIARTLIERGVKITVLTNSLATNDVALAHAAYVRSRRKIIETGVELYEMRGDAERAEGDRAETISLHSKYIVVDEDVVFLGSLNLDPRSLYLNTELGVVLRSPALATQLRASFQSLIRPENAWRVTRTADGPQWESSAGIITKEPARNFWQRWRFRLYLLLPLSSQL